MFIRFSKKLENFPRTARETVTPPIELISNRYPSKWIQQP